MVLVAATAAGLVVSRSFVPDLTPEKVWQAIMTPNRGWSTAMAVAVILDATAVLVVPSLAAWSVALFIPVDVVFGHARHADEGPRRLALLRVGPPQS